MALLATGTGHSPSPAYASEVTLDSAVGLTPSVVNLGPNKDNTLYEDLNGSISNGAGQHFFAGRTNQGLIRRGVMATDIVSMIPAGSTIDGVSLTLHMSRTPSSLAQTVELHKLVADWGEGTSDAPFNEGMGIAATPGDATWIHTFSDTATWATPGGDFSATVSASQVVGAVGDYTWTSAQMAAENCREMCCFRTCETGG